METKEVEVIKEYIGREAQKAYELFWDSLDRTVKKFSIWSDGRISCNEQAKSDSISFGLYANGKEETLEEWIAGFDKELKEVKLNGI